ncbi:MAG: tetraacyldisaccharide 4'-kinase [Proteobacteria bacterium]|nr:tetraacyldisaccharide 4'-kinase [Pseudomonadota bacterium]
MARPVRDLLWLVLLPASWIYSLGVNITLRLRKRNDPGLFVISVGNIHLGGTGKTPVVIQLANHLASKNPVILSRGYKSQSTKIGVQLDRASAAGPRQFGDEPWVISHSTKSDVYVGANRFDLIRKYNLANRYQVAILDDGFQHVQLERSMNLLILPGDQSPWEMACVPLGDLREGLNSIKRASLILITCVHPDSRWIRDWKSLAGQLAPHAPCFVGMRKIISVLSEAGERVSLDKKKFGAFCGIGRPERFFEDLSQWGPIEVFKTFRDHHAYTKSEIEELIKTAKERAVEFFVTTEKDFFKVKDIFREFNFPLRVAHAEYELPKEFWETVDIRMRQAC